MSAPEWQYIETAPGGGTRVLLAYADGSVEVGYHQVVERIVNGVVGYRHEGWVPSRAYGSPNKPTHWMPLPLAPVDAFVEAVSEFSREASRLVDQLVADGLTIQSDGLSPIYINPEDLPGE